VGRVKSEGDDVHPIREVVRENRKQDHKADRSASLERQADRDPVEGAMHDEADWRKHPQPPGGPALPILRRGWVDVIAVRTVIVGMLKARLVEECLDETEADEPDHCSCPDLQGGIGSGKVVGLGQQVRDRRGNHDTRREGHEGVQSVAEPKCRKAAQQRRKERENRGEWHGATW